MAQNVAESNTQLSGGRNMPVDPASARSLSQSSNATSTLPRNEVQEEKPGKDRPKSVSFSSNGKTLHGTPGDGAVEQDCSAHPAVRTVPRGFHNYQFAVEKYPLIFPQHGYDLWTKTTRIQAPPLGSFLLLLPTPSSLSTITHPVRNEIPSLAGCTIVRERHYQSQ